MISKSLEARLSALIDQDYIRKRNALIPLAEKRANKEYGAHPPKGNVKAKAEYAAKWSRVFHAEIERLWKKRRMREFQ